MKKEKLRHYANVIASNADAHWVTPFFFIIFFLDSLLLVIPVDSLLGASMSLRPRHIKKWLLASTLGFALGLGILALVANSHLQPWAFKWFEELGYFHHVEKVLEQAENYGYLSLTIGVFTILPSLFGVIIGVLVGLNPWVVWALSLGGKIVKLILTVWLIFSGSQVFKKILKIYLKTSV